jgi:GT2 family glycosyltransferase
VGAVGAKLLYPNGTLQHAGILIGVKGLAGHAHRGLPEDRPGYFGQANAVKNCSAVTAACLMIRRELFQRIGGFNERLSMTCNDLDLCFRLLETGHRIVYTPYASLYHHESHSRGWDDNAERSARSRGELLELWKLWGERVHSDPYYNPNLTHWKEDFSLSTPWDKRSLADFIAGLSRIKPSPSSSDPSRSP